MTLIIETMETKTIILSEKEGKRYEIQLANSFIPAYITKAIYWGTVEDFLKLPNKEETS